jgi:hypothetical protein
VFTCHPGANQPPAAGPFLGAHRPAVAAVDPLGDRGDLLAPGSAEPVNEPAQVERAMVDWSTSAPA